MTDTHPRRRPLGPALTRVPPVDTAVMDLYTRELGHVTGDAGYAERYDGTVAIALVLFEGRPHEDVVFVSRLVLAEE